MKLKFEFIDEDTGQRIVVKNKNTTIMLHNSNVHDDGEFEPLSDRVLRLEASEKILVNTFYDLASKLQYI